MTRLQMAARAAAMVMISSALMTGTVSAQSGDSAPPRGLDFRLPPADDGRDSNVQGPTDNGLPPRQEAPKSAPAPKAAPPPIVPPKAVPTVPAPKAPAPAPAQPRPAPKAAAPVAVPAPAPTVQPPADAAPVPSAEPDLNMLPPLTEEAAPSGDVLPEENPAFLPSETEEPSAAEQDAQQKQMESPWWAWLVAGAIALGLAALYWRRQTAIRPEDYLEEPQPAAPVPTPAPAPTPPAPKPVAAPIPAATPAPTPAPAPAALRPAAPAPLAPQPAAPTPPPVAPRAPEPASAPAAQAPLRQPVPPAPQAPSEKAQPAWQNLDEYVSAGSLVRRPAEERRATVDMDMAVRSIRVEADHIAVGFILTLTNSGEQPATGLMVRIALGQGSAMHEAVLGRFYDGAGGSILRDDMELAAGRSEQLSSEVKLPRTSVEPMVLAGKPLLVPVLAADITYHWDGDDDAFGQIAGAYVLGRAAVGGSEKLAPIPLDRAPLAVDRPGARATEMVRRQ